MGRSAVALQHPKKAELVPSSAGWSLLILGSAPLAGGPTPRDHDLRASEGLAVVVPARNAGDRRIRTSDVGDGTLAILGVPKSQPRLAQELV